MKIKQKIEDFRVRELLREDVLSDAGAWRVYRVTKRKLTSLEAAARVAREAGSSAGEVSMAGFKDRQGVTVQYMALHKGREVRIVDPDLRVETVGFAREELTPAASEGNAFEIVVRGLEQPELERIRSNLPRLREGGLVNYFDDQRFGNLRHGQGWIALRLIRGQYEAALQDLLASPSSHDDASNRAFKSALQTHWGKWQMCRDIAGRFGQHHSLFEHLKRSPEDFAGAFKHLSTRLRLIHLYAFQSHLWNRAVAECVRRAVPAEERIVVDSDEGPLIFPARGRLVDLGVGPSFRLPGPRLEDVEHPRQLAALEDALAGHRLVAADFDIPRVPGFQLKGEERALFVSPEHLRVRPAERDTLNRDMRLVKVRFELPRGSYATLVVRRLMAPVGGEEAARRESYSRRDDRPQERGRTQRGRRPGAQSDARRPQGEHVARRDSARRGPADGGAGRGRSGNQRGGQGRSGGAAGGGRGGGAGPGGRGPGGSGGSGGSGDRGGRGGRRGGTGR